ncbi:MAG TPA: recombinase family protein [Chitinophagaceae bacterium]
MKQRAYLYIRVSTDEQADKGYSQKHQDEKLRQHCAYHNIEIAGVYWEDYSGKTFDRPEFTNFLQYAKKNRKSADLLLFLKWDRFSRNVAESYAMIHQLSKLGIEPQAIEQPLDMSIPESKIMLAIYLAAPEVENDRRALNVIAGMRKAMKEGRHMNMAPKGYRNTRDENNNPIIEPGKDAPLIKWAFEEVERGIYNVMEVWRMVKAKGLNVSKSQIWNMFRNPFYYGKLFIPAYKNEEAVLIKGVHKPLISEGLFNDVQDILNGRKRKALGYQHGLREEFPLRGNLLCKKCGRLLTASTSKGNGGTYYYYHCVKGCKERFHSEEVNNSLNLKLEKYKANENAKEYNKAVLMHYLNIDTDGNTKKVELLQAEIQKNKERIGLARKKVLDDLWDDEDFKETKQQCQPVIERLERELAKLTGSDSTIDDQVEFCTHFFTNLPGYYKTADLILKRQIVGLIYPEKFVFKDNSIQTNRTHAAIPLICRTGKDFNGDKNKMASKNGGHSNVVTASGFKPETF